MGPDKVDLTPHIKRWEERLEPPRVRQCVPRDAAPALVRCILCSRNRCFTKDHRKFQFIDHFGFEHVESQRLGENILAVLLNPRSVGWKSSWSRIPPSTRAKASWPWPRRPPGDYQEATRRLPGEHWETREPKCFFHLRFPNHSSHPLHCTRPRNPKTILHTPSVPPKACDIGSIYRCRCLRGYRPTT